LHQEEIAYSPTWVEWSILAGSLSSFVLLYVLFTKFFPIVSIWEVKEGREKAIAEATRRIRGYLPGPEESQAGEEASGLLSNRVELSHA
jgi:hypothetical protein